MVPRVKRKLFLFLFLSIMLSSSLTLNLTPIKTTAIASSIMLGEFCWNRFPLKVLVNMNEWGTDNYAIAVHEALDNWLKSIWNYTHTYTNMTLAFNYLLYVSNVNSTRSYDIVISFSQNEFDQKIVGITTSKWNGITHEPIAPIQINITTYSATAQDLFVKNVAMHELGHALGLGHAISPETINGPELMYPSSTLEQVVYPSTLDVYGLLMLYKNNFHETVSLPSNIPNKMLSEATILYPNPTVLQQFLSLLISDIPDLIIDPQAIFYEPMRLIVPSLLWMVMTVVLTLLFHSEKKAILVSICSFVFLCYFTFINPDIVSIGLKTGLILPSIIIGASIGRFLGNTGARKKIETVPPRV